MIITKFNPRDKVLIKEPGIEATVVSVRQGADGGVYYTVRFWAGGLPEYYEAFGYELKLVESYESIIEKEKNDECNRFGS